MVDAWRKFVNSASKVTMLYDTIWNRKLQQRRNDGRQGRRNSPDAGSLWEHRKVLTMSQALSSIADLFPKDLRIEHGGAKLVSYPGAI